MPPPDTLAAWLQRADDELLYDADRPPCEPTVRAPTGAEISGIVLAEVQRRRRTTGTRLGEMRLALHPSWYAALRAYCAELNALAVREPVLEREEESLQLYGVVIVPVAWVTTYLFLGCDPVADGA